MSAGGASGAWARAGVIEMSAPKGPNNKDVQRGAKADAAPVRAANVSVMTAVGMACR